MKVLFLHLLLLLICTRIAFGQDLAKPDNMPAIDISILGKWPFVQNITVSNDGKYAAYSIKDPLSEMDSIVIQSLQTNWRFQTRSLECQITNDGKSAIFRNSRDSLGILELGTNNIEYVSHVNSFKCPKGGTGGWLAYRSGTPEKLIVRSLQTKKELSFESVSNYVFNDSGTAILLEITRKTDGSEAESLVWFQLGNENGITIWSSKDGKKVGQMFFSRRGSGLAFVVETKSENKTAKSIWDYEVGSDKAVLLADDHSPGIDKDLSIGGIDYLGFSADNKTLFLDLREDDIVRPKDDGARVDVWSYTDPTLQSQQLNSLKPRVFVAAFQIQDHRLLRLEQEDEKLISNSNNDVLIVHSKSVLTACEEWHWNKAAQSSIFLVSLKNGTRQLLKDGLPSTVANSYRLSPEGKYVIYYDPQRKDYFSYEVASGTRRNITSGAGATWTTYAHRDILMAPYMPIGGAGWIKDDKAVLLYDQFDIFQADPSGQHPVINLTNGYGRKRNIEFRLAIEKPDQLFSPGDKLTISAFNRISKDDGFFCIRISEKKDPQRLTMQPCILKGTWEDDRFYPTSPIKARDTEVYLVKRMTAEESPNYYWTSDFKEFNRLTDVHPERKYNWITSELITWKTLDGSYSQGILYKPENFSPNKKYPVIFHYYERFSEGLHGFLAPDFNDGVLNVPYYVSNGYLVFLPDIHYRVGHPGKSVVNALVSAAKHLSKFSFVDSNHMGIQGHSRGGWETNFLVTHTNIFAAAMSSSGMSDYISLYDGIRALASGVSRQPAFEMNYQRIGATLWERPDLYVENSPIFKANEVSTPLLMMGNKEDADVPFEQGIEFFTALRRLGKKVWMLQYDGQGHLVFGSAGRDLTIRVKQFFDHYLKGLPAPRWMVSGIPARMKGQTDGLQLERSGVEPGPGLLYRLKRS